MTPSAPETFICTACAKTCAMEDIGIGSDGRSLHFGPTGPPEHETASSTGICAVCYEKILAERKAMRNIVGDGPEEPV
jgi:hypothetical protein